MNNQTMAPTKSRLVWTRAAVARWLGLICLLGTEAVVLRYLRWQSIEDAKALASADLSFLAAHRDLVKAILFVTIAVALLLFKESRGLSLRKIGSQQSVDAPTLGFNLLAFILLAALIRAVSSSAVNAWLEVSLWGVPALYTLLTLGWLAVVASAFALLVPPGWALHALSKNKVGVAVVALGAVGYVVSQSLLTEFESVWSRMLLPPTVYVATQFSALIGIGAVAKPGTTFFGTPTFIVDIGPTCLGYQGVSIVLILLLTYILTSKDRLHTGRALLVLPGAVAAMLLFNALRISTLVTIGDVWSPEIAVMGFHSTAGWVELILTLLVAIAMLSQHRFFQRAVVAQESEPVDGATGTDLLLVPQVVLIGVSFITQMFTGEFYWLYPVHIGAAAVAIWLLRSRLPKIELGAPVTACTAGVAVFIVWIVLIPADPEKAVVFASNLFDASPFLIVVWLIFRVLGTSMVVPIVEELAFRGFLLTEAQKHLQKSLPPYAAMGVALGVSSVIFGVLHSAWLAGSVAGLAYGMVYLYRSKLYDAVLAHAITNVLLVFYALTLERWSYL